MKKLHFVTLMSGTIVEYDRDAIDDEVIHRMLEVIHGDGRLVKGWSVVIKIQTADEAQFEIVLDNEPVTHCWVCLDQISSERVWHNATTWGMPLHPGLVRPATVPWLAATMVPTIASVALTRPERLVELPMIEVAIAWAFAQRRH